MCTWPFFATFGMQISKVIHLKIAFFIWKWMDGCVAANGVSTSALNLIEWFYVMHGESGHTHSNTTEPHDHIKWSDFFPYSLCDTQYIVVSKYKLFYYSWSRSDRYFIFSVLLCQHITTLRVIKCAICMWKFMVEYLRNETPNECDDNNNNRNERANKQTSSAISS